jgi:hypothetical protein
MGASVRLSTVLQRGAHGMRRQLSAYSYSREVA